MGGGGGGGGESWWFLRIRTSAQGVGVVVNYLAMRKGGRGERENAGRKMGILPKEKRSQEGRGNLTVGQDFLVDKIPSKGTSLNREEWEKGETSGIALTEKRPKLGGEKKHYFVKKNGEKEKRISARTQGGKKREKRKEETGKGAQLLTKKEIKKKNEGEAGVITSVH